MSVCKGKSITKVPFIHFGGHIHTYIYIHMDTNIDNIPMVTHARAG